MDTKNIGEGFYRSDAWPYYFMVNRPSRHPVLTLWGFSIWKNSPGYRTYGNDLSKWLADHPNAKIERDTDRTLDKVFLRDWRAKTRAANGGIPRGRAGAAVTPTTAHLKALGYRLTRSEVRGVYIVVRPDGRFVLDSYAMSPAKSWGLAREYIAREIKAASAPAENQS